MADHDLTCHPPEGGGAYLVWVTIGFFESEIPASLFMDIGRNGEGTYGILETNRTSTILVAGSGDQTAVACADADQDGIPGISTIRMDLESQRKDVPGVISVLVIPTTGELDESGWQPAVAEVTGRVTGHFEGQVLVVSSRDGRLR